MALNLDIRETPERRIIPPPDEQVPLREENPGFWEIMGSAARRENTVGSFIANLDTLGKRYDPVEGYNPFEGNDGTIFERHPMSLIEVYSPEEKDDLRIKLEREEEDLGNLFDTGFMGWGAAMALGIFDPLILVPFGGAAGAARMGVKAGMLAGLSAPLQGGIRTMRAATAGAAVTEAVLQSQQEARTWGETALNIGGTAFLSGVLGSTIARMDQALTRAAVKDVERELGVVAGGRGDDPNVVHLTADEAMSDSAGTTQHGEIRLTDSFGSAKVVSALRLSPFVRLMVRSRSNELKKALLGLADSPVLVKGWSPETSAFQQVEGWHVKTGLLNEHRRTQFALYRERVSGDKAGGRIADARRNLKDRLVGKEHTVLDEAEFNIEVTRALHSNDRSPIPEVQDVAKHYREELFNPMLKKMMDTGRLPEDFTDFDTVGAMSYITRIYNREAIVAHRDKFGLRINAWLRNSITDDELDAIAKKHRGLSHEEAITIEVERYTEDIIDNIVGWNDARLLIDPIKPGKSSVMKARALTIDDEVLRHPIPDGEGGWIHFLDNDIEKIAQFYTRTAAPDVELMERFGSLDMADQVRAIREDYRKVIDAEPNPKKKVKLSKQMKKELDVLGAIRQRLTGEFAKPEESGGITAMRVARAANVFAQMGGVALSSVPDAGMIVMRNGLWKTFKHGLVPLVTNLNSFRLAAKELKLMGVGLEMLETRAGAMADMGDEFARNRLEAWSQNLTKGFMMMNLMAPWNTMMKRLTGIITQTRMIEAIQDLQRGAISKMDMEDLIQGGISESMASRIAKELDRSGGMSADGPVKWAHTTNWEDLEVRLAFQAAMRNIVDQTIVTPGIADRPLLMSYELGKTLGQYRSFAMTATQRVLITGLQRRNAAALNGAALMMALGVGVEHAKSQLAGKEGPTDPYGLFKAGLDRSGTVGIFSDFVNILERTGMLPFMRGPLSSRYAARNTTSAILGPTVGLGESAIQLAIAAGNGNWSQSETRTARRILPYQQIFYWRSLFDYAEDGVNEAFGIPKRSRR